MARPSRSSASLLNTVLVGAISCLAFACGMTGIRLPSHHLAGEGPAALKTGTLTDRGGCLFIEAGPDRSAVIWPQGFSRDGDLIYQGDRMIARVGSLIELGGGGYSEDQYNFLRTLMDQDLPSACREGAYWLTTSVRALPDV